MQTTINLETHYELTHYVLLSFSFFIGYKSIGNSFTSIKLGILPIDNCLGLGH